MKRNSLTGWLGFFLMFLLTSGSPVFAHAFWVVPFDGQTESGSRVVFDLRIGPVWPGVSTTRQTDSLIRRFDVTDDKGTYPIKGRENARPVGNYIPHTPGANIVVMTTFPYSIQLPGNEFDEYLKEEGLTDALAYREKLGISGSGARERFRRVAKTLIFVDGKSDGFNRNMNLPFEIIPITDPLVYHPGERFSVRIIQNGQSLENIQVTAMGDLQSEKKIITRTDKDGVASFDLPIGGRWVIYAVNTESAQDLDADWESIWTSLTFTLGDNA